eukprot:CAMPEP_0198124548 /NCGR_PEP_ID=MMETSP1442-20131203/40141_1 /TAXON_ID= /ORGANISM="Craspedostauros australis, Strain CCMP3328" /LENGTH=102 /DNA_ID=CAMNT_0043783961 /DNA_START=113 /DNA_END=422 /DNA_ORIENTATION=-
MVIIFLNQIEHRIDDGKELRAGGSRRNTMSTVAADMAVSNGVTSCSDEGCGRRWVTKNFMECHIPIREMAKVAGAVPSAFVAIGNGGGNDDADMLSPWLRSM